MPGLKDKLTGTGTGTGSPLSYDNGTTPTANPLSLSTSTLHSNGNINDSYSLNGSNQPTVSTGYQQYRDGDPINTLPTPSILDKNGQKPSDSYDVTGPPEGLGNI